MDINNFSDEDLKQLMKKYKEKQERYNLMYNEATIRNERIILNIHLEQLEDGGKFIQMHLEKQWIQLMIRIEIILFIFSNISITIF